MTSDRRARLTPVFNRYAGECRDRAATLVLILEQEAPDLPSLILHSHSLAGSGATMGAESLSADARRLEEDAKAIREAGRGPDAAELHTMRGLAQSLRTAAEGFDAETMLDAFIAKMFPNG